MNDRSQSSSRGETIAKLGTVVSAIVASSCCWLPLLLLAVGVSGAGIVLTLEEYRPIFMVVTFGFLGAAFYFTYRPKRVAKSDDCCGETATRQTDCRAAQPTPVTDCCTPTSKRRFNIMALNKAMLWAVTVLAIAFLFFPQYINRMIGAGGGTFTADMQRTILIVEGMTCAG